MEKKKKIIKLVNHELTSEQKAGLEGYEIIPLPETLAAQLKQCGSDLAELKKLSNRIINNVRAQGAELVLSPGGSPAFNAIFSVEGHREGIRQVFSHSVREFEEQTQEDGSVKKVNVFRHVCFIGLPEENASNNDRSERIFNDKDGNRDRSCRYCVVHSGRALSRNEAEEQGLAKFIALDRVKDGKWSNTTWKVKLKDGARLVVMMAPFRGWSGELQPCLNHIMSQYNNDCTIAEAEAAFKWAYPERYARIKENEEF